MPDSAEFDDVSSTYRFPLVQFTSEILDEGPVINKTLIVQVMEKYTEVVKKTKEFVKKERAVGEVSIKMREALEKARTNSMSYEVKDENGKVVGVLEMKDCSLRNFHTFLDLHIKNGLNLVPIVAVDFSLANLTFDEN